MAETDFGPMMGAVAVELLGEPNRRLSKKNELRFGSHGSLSIRTDKGTFYDNEAEVGGGVLDLIARETGATGGAAIDWLRDHGFHVEDDERPAKQARKPNGDHREPERRERPEGVLEAEYTYTDAAGKPVLIVERFRLPEPERKTFRQRLPSGKRSVKGAPVVPYNLPNVLEAIKRGEPVFVVEGEKDVENMRDLLQLVATCNAGGAGKWTEAHAKALAGADLVWLPDNDDAGRSHVANGALLTKPFAARQRVLDLPDLDEKGDVSDWIERGGDRPELDALLRDRSRIWTPEPPKSKFGAIMFQHLDDYQDDEHAFIIDDFFTVCDVSGIAGPSGSGKSFLAIHAGMLVSYAALAGRMGWKELDFFGRRIIEGGLVVYQAGEGARGVKKRIRAWRQEFGVPPSAPLPFLLMKHRVDIFRDKDVPAFIAEIKAWQAFYDLPLKMIFIDTLATAIPGAEENSAKDMTTVMDNCARIRDECGCHVSLVAHMNAQGTKMRGSTATFANLDNVLTVRRDEATKVRTLELAKQKDEDDDIAVRFELKRIELGYDEKRRKQRSSCICVELGEKDSAADNTDRARTGFTLKGEQERQFYVALRDALASDGIAPPASIDGVPASVQSVVEWEAVKTRFEAKLWRDTDDTAETFAERSKKAAQRAGKALGKFGIIGRSFQGRGRNYLWLSGKPVVGFPKAPIAPPKSSGGELLARLEADPLAEDRPGDLGFRDPEGT